MSQTSDDKSPIEKFNERMEELAEKHRTIYPELNKNLDEKTWNDLFKAINNYAYRMSAAGSFDHQYQQVFTGFDKYGYNPIVRNTVLSGYTFITRPKLNLSPGATQSHETLNLLMTKVPNSPLFALRCMLDTKYCSDYFNDAKQCKMIDLESPFLNLLTNCSRSNSGWQDLNGDIHTTEGGYFNEDQTAFLGFDNLNRTYDISFEFEDVQGGHVMALFYYWFIYMYALKRGQVFAYAEDIDMRRLCYTCSIYRFLLDPSKQVIVGWAKGTGCFPKSVPLGATFNINSGELHVSSAQRFSIPFTVNKIEYNTPFIISDFNILMRRFDKDIGTDAELQAPINEPGYNFVGKPYIVARNGAYRLQWYYKPEKEPVDGIYRLFAEAKARIQQNNTENV